MKNLLYMKSSEPCTEIDSIGLQRGLGLFHGSRDVFDQS